MYIHSQSELNSEPAWASPSVYPNFCRKFCHSPKNEDIIFKFDEHTATSNKSVRLKIVQIRLNDEKSSVHTLQVILE